MIRTPLNIVPTLGCINHPYHPSVVYVPEGWNGHAFWMAQTPFPPMDMAPYKDRYEMPCIHNSDDGIRWYPAMNRPVEELTQEEVAAKDYYSDPHLLIVDGLMMLYYRFSVLEKGDMQTNKTLLYRRTSKNGVDWSERELVADLRTNKDQTIWGEQIISQAIMYRNGLYRCWYVDASNWKPERGVRVIESEDGILWHNAQKCTFNAGAIIPWHLDVQFQDGAYRMLGYDLQTQAVRLYISNDGVAWQELRVIIAPSGQEGDFYSADLYRACSVQTNKGYNIYFSANDGKQSYIGLLQTKDWKSFRPVNGMYAIQWMCTKWSWKILKRRIKKALKA